MKPAKAPDRQASLAQYRKRAAVYDLELALFEPIRLRAVARLALQPGETVFDVGCGTGLSLEGLRSAVGDGGHVLGVEQSPEMIERARQRVAEHGWRNVSLVCAPVEAAALPVNGAAALFHFTHDILRQPPAVAHVVRHLRPAARVVASGLQWTSGLAWPANVLVLPAAWRSVTTFEGLDRPWNHLAALTSPPRLESAWCGAVYIASGMRVPRQGKLAASRTQ